MQPLDHNEPPDRGGAAAQHAAAGHAYAAPIGRGIPRRALRAGLAWLAGLAGAGVLLALGGLAWLALGVATQVWVDGCPDVAPPLAPVLWRRVYVCGLGPLVAGLCGWAGARFGRRLAGGSARILSARDDAPTP